MFSASYVLYKYSKVLTRIYISQILILLFHTPKAIFLCKIRNLFHKYQLVSWQVGGSFLAQKVVQHFFHPNKVAQSVSGVERDRNITLSVESMWMFLLKATLVPKWAKINWWHNIKCDLGALCASGKLSSAYCTCPGGRWPSRWSEPTPPTSSTAGSLSLLPVDSLPLSPTDPLVESVGTERYRRLF